MQFGNSGVCGFPFFPKKLKMLQLCNPSHIPTFAFKKNPYDQVLNLQYFACVCLCVLCIGSGVLASFSAFATRIAGLRKHLLHMSFERDASSASPSQPYQFQR